MKKIAIFLSIVTLVLASALGTLGVSCNAPDEGGTGLLFFDTLGSFSY